VAIEQWKGVDMDTFETIKKRRSVRQYTGESIPKGALLKIVDAGRWAPSGHNRQPWDFIVVTNRKMISELKIASEWMENAGAIIAVVLDPKASKFWLEDGSAAIENMLLASTALGFGSCWLQGYTEPREAEFKILLGVPEEKRLLTLIPIGVPTSWPEKEKKSLDEVLHWEKYESKAPPDKSAAAP
jgi:nitroreductase